MSRRDRAVQKTDDDAAGTKASAVSKCYYSDKYIPYFVRHPVQRFPLINIGTYCRIKALNDLVDAFLAATEAQEYRQIVSLGAGSDTRPFHVLPSHNNLIYHEIDYPTMTTKKTRVIKSHSDLQESIKWSSADPGDSVSEIHSSIYHLHGIDLRDLPKAELPHLQNVPTLVISECCLCYLAPDESSAILNYFKSSLSQIAVLLYEPISLGDEFGRVMAENLSQRGLCLPTFQKFDTLEAQKSRLSALGLASIGADDIFQVYSEWLTGPDRSRVSGLELLDEVEEMNMLLKHYCIAYGSSPDMPVVRKIGSA